MRKLIILQILIVLLFVSGCTADTTHTEFTDTAPAVPAQTESEVFSQNITDEYHNEDKPTQNETQTGTYGNVISEEEAYKIACDYWNYSKGAVDEETGFELSVECDGLFKESDGSCYYIFRLLWWVIDHSSTIDCVHINAETGECSSELVKTNQPAEATPLEYWVSYCDSQFFAEEDLVTFGKEECLIARNAVYAKSGRKFNDASLQTYFAQFNWYHPTVSPSEFSNNMLNATQLHNLNLILTYETNRGYR